MLGMLIGAAVASKVIDTVSEAVIETSERIKKNKINSMQDMVFMNQDAFYFHQKNYLDVIHWLLGMGFTNVNAVEIRKYNQGFFTKNLYGQVQSVSINGDDSFEEGSHFAKGAHVVVAFHVYKDSPHVVIPELEQRTSASEYGRQPSHMGYDYQQPVNINVNIDNGTPQYGYSGSPTSHSNEANYFDPNNKCYCQYCGALMPNAAGFCPRCGAPVGR